MEHWALQPVGICKASQHPHTDQLHLQLLLQIASLCLAELYLKRHPGTHRSSVLGLFAVVNLVDAVIIVVAAVAVVLQLYNNI